MVRLVWGTATIALHCCQAGRCAAAFISGQHGSWRSLAQQVLASRTVAIKPRSRAYTTCPAHSTRSRPRRSAGSLPCHYDGAPVLQAPRTACEAHDRHRHGINTRSDGGGAEAAWRGGVQRRAAALLAGAAACLTPAAACALASPGGAAAGGAGWQLVSEFCAAQDASARALAKQLLGARLPPIGRALVLAKAGWSGTDAGLLVGYHAGLLPLAVAATIAGQLACLAVTYALLRTLLAGGAEVRRDPAALRAPSAAPPSLREVADWAAFNATRSAVDRVAAQRNATLAFGGAGGAHPAAAAAAATAAAMRIDALAEVRGFDLSSTSGQLLAQAVVEGMARGGGADGGGGYGETARPLTALLDARMLAELREMEGTRVGGYTLVSTRGGRDPAVTRMAAAAALAGPRWALLAAVLLRVRPAAAATGVASGIALSAMAVASLVTAGQAHAAVLYCVVRDCVGSPARALLQVEWLMRLLVGKYLLLELQRTFKRSLQRSRARRLQLQHQRQQLQQQYEDQEQQQR